MSRRLIESAADIAEGAAWLVSVEPRFEPVVAECSPLPLRRRPDGFEALFFAIVSQQVSVASATAIWARCQEAGLTSEAAVAAASDEALRAAGLSRPKQRYARALAAADIDYARLRDVPDAEVISTLVAVPGIGPWTAEIYAMFSLGRPDIFAPGDLAMQEAARVLFDLPARPTERVFRQMAEAWSPWRSVAARALWAYYQHIKSREGIV